MRYICVFLPTHPQTMPVQRAITDMTADHPMLYALHTIEEAHTCKLINDLGAESPAHYSWSIDENNLVVMHMTVHGPINVYNLNFEVHHWRWIPDHHLCVCFWPISVMHLCHRPWKIQLNNHAEIQMFMQFISMQ